MRHNKILLFALVWALASLFAGGALAWEETREGFSAAANAAGNDYLKLLIGALQAYARKDSAGGLAKLDEADKLHLGIPDAWTIRGIIYVQEHRYDNAETAFATASRMNPLDFWLRYDEAQLLLTEGKFAEAEAAFEKLKSFSGHEELTSFEIVLADLLLGKPEAAKPVLDAMKYPPDTPAYYFAHAAWAFAHKDTKEGNAEAQSGLNIFGAKCTPFYGQLSQRNWLPTPDKAPRMPFSWQLPIDSAEANPNDFFTEDKRLRLNLRAHIDAIPSASGTTGTSAP